MNLKVREFEFIFPVVLSVTISNLPTQEVGYPTVENINHFN